MALGALKKGDFTVRLPLNLPGLPGKVADAFNEVVEMNQRLAGELERVSRVVGRGEESLSGPTWDSRRARGRRKWLR